MNYVKNFVNNSVMNQLMNRKQAAIDSFGRLYDTIIRLRSPEGCPWDREQSLKSLRSNLAEEAYECIEAINENDIMHIEEELGDVFLVSTMMGVIAEESDKLSLASAMDKTVDKLVRRHPHVFGDNKLDTAEAVTEQWNKIKENKEGRRKKDSVLDRVSNALPPLEKAYKIQKAAAKTGFDWPNADGAWDKLKEELEEARAAASALANEKGENAEEKWVSMEEELGDLLFSVVNTARKHGIDPSLALHRATEKFSRRFLHVEKSMAKAKEKMQPDKLEQMDQFWEEAKNMEKPGF